MQNDQKRGAKTLSKASFEPVLKTYVYLSGILFLIATLVGIILLPVWLIAGRIYVNRYFKNLECELTSRSLYFKKGVWFVTEKTVPLDKIQDLTFKEGPILRYLGISRIMIETAGNSSQGISDMSLIGIAGAREFREMVLDQRDEITDKNGSSSAKSGRGPGSDPISELIPILSEMNETLKRIESKTGK